MDYQTRAMTLIELVICLAIASVLMIGVLPAFSNIVERSGSSTVVNWLIGTVNYTRHAAISYNSLVTLCPSRDGKQCGGKWHEGTIVFTDANGNRKIDSNDTFLERFSFPLDSGSVRWRAFQNKQYLQMTGEGYTNYQNGNFVYCASNGDLSLARQLVINIQGRARRSIDIDGDGIVEDRLGKDLNC